MSRSRLPVAALTITSVLVALLVAACPPADTTAPAIVLVLPNGGEACADGVVCTFDVGNVTDPAGVDVTFVLQNTGDGAGEITGAEVSGATNVAVASAPKAIAAGASGDFVVHVGQTFARVEATATVTWVSPEHVIHLLLQAGDSSAPHLRVDPPACAFGSVPEGQAATCLLTLSNDGNRDLVIDSVVVSNDAGGVFSVSGPLDARTIPPGENAQASIDAVPTGAGAFSGVARISSNDPGNAALFVTLTVDSAPHLVLPDQGCDFGDVPAGNLVTCSLTIGNDGGADLILTNIAVTGDTNALGLTAAPPDQLVVAPQSSISIETATAPPAAGVFDGALTFGTNDPDNPSGSIPLHVNGI